MPCLVAIAAKCSSCLQIHLHPQLLRVKMYTRQSPSTAHPNVLQEILENIIQREWPNDPKAPRQFYEVPFSPEMAAAQQRGDIEQATAVLHGATSYNVTVRMRTDTVLGRKPCLLARLHKLERRHAC